MRRVLASAFVLGTLGVFAFFALGVSGGGNSGVTYWIQLDNAFGLIKGGDAKIAGVRAGKISDLQLDQKTKLAEVQVNITQSGWGSLRKDVTCDSRPQSLIGEYFIDCLPGTSNQPLPKGECPSRPHDLCVPVGQTSSTIAPDLVNDIMREPYKERFRIIINELGAAVGGNSNNLNQALRRAVPALRETDQVLGILAAENHTLADLVTNGDTVISALAANRADVGRWVIQAGNAATASAERRAALAAGFQKLPGFLEQLRPAMVQLGAVADQQTPALRTLNASAHQLDVLVRSLKPFAEASQPAFAALGRAAQTGRSAVQAATPTIQQLNTFAQGAPELGQNLAIVLEHLDDPRYAVEADPRSPGGRGWTGLQDLLNYVFWQSTSVNIFDQSEHLLNTSNFVPGECGTIEDAKAVRANPQLFKDCGENLGPTVPGINAPDPSAAQGGPTAAGPRRLARLPAQHGNPGAGAGGTGAGSRSGITGVSGGSGGSAGSQPGLPKLSDLLPGAGAGTGVAGSGVNVPSVPQVTGPGAGVAHGTSGPSGPGGVGHSDGGAGQAGQLLNYLMGP